MKVSSRSHLLLFLILLLWPGSNRALPGSQVLVSTDRWVELEVEVPSPTVSAVPGTPWVRVAVSGYGSLGEPGAPALPSGGLLLAIPPRGEPRLTILEVEEGLSLSERPEPVPFERILEDEPEGLPVFDVRHESDSEIYGGAHPYPAAVVSLGRSAWMRHQRVVSVRVTPVQWDPGSGVLRSARRIRFRVDFGAPVDPSKTVGGRPVSGGGGWERIYASQVLNYEQGKSWRWSPRVSRSLKSTRGSGGRIKITVPGRHRREVTGLRRLSYEALSSAGLPETPDWDEVTLWESWYEEDHRSDPFREQEIPYAREDGDGDGRFESGESLVFFAQDRWDRFDLPEGERRFGRDNVYWLAWDRGRPTAMEERVSWHGWTDLPPPPLQIQTQVFEKDSIYGWPATTDDRSGTLPLGTGMMQSSHYTWTYEGRVYSEPPHWVFFKLPREARPLRLVAELQGIRWITTNVRHLPSLFLAWEAEGSEPWTQWPFPDNPYWVTPKSRYVITLEGDQLAGVDWSQAPDSMALVMDFPSDGHGISLDRIAVTYERDYYASLGAYSLQTAGMMGEQEFRIDAFDYPDILAFEVTDSVRVARLVVTDDQIEETYGVYRVILQIDAGDGSSPRSFVIAQSGSIPEVPAGQLRYREIADLTAPGSQDYLAIYHEDFADSLQPLLQHRVSFGHSVLAVDVEDIYDVFNGGRKSPVPIRSFLRYLFRTRQADAPVYLLLVGDASNDHANVNAMSDPDYMPTMSLPSRAGSTQGSEMVSMDEWFVDNLTGSGESMDFYPDMHVGRLPAGDEEQLSVMVRKVIRYEDFRDEDQWRNRGIFHADDQYSSTISFDQEYCFRDIEYVFERGCNDALEHLFDAGFMDFEVDSFYLSKHLDTLRVVSRCEKDTSGIGGDPCDPELSDIPCRFDDEGNIAYCECVDWVPNRDQGEGGPQNRGPLAVKLLSSLGKGGIFWNVQSHSNARLIGHEFVFRNTNTQRMDVLEIQNIHKPFLFFGFGCHLAEFASWNEAIPRQKDCIGEWLLFHGTSDLSMGGIGAVGSTAYEWLRANDQLNTALFDAFFTNPPQPDGRSRWIFGEIFTAGKNILMARNHEDAAGMMTTYTYLGDPALRMDLAPPRLHVRVNGEEIEDGAFVTSNEVRDSVHLEVGVLDEVAVGELSVQDYGGTLPSQRIEVIPDANRPDRAFRAVFDLGLRPDTYGVTLRTVDGSSRERIFALQLELVSSFSVVVGGEERPLEEGGFVPDSAEVVVTVESPVYLRPDDHEILVDGLVWDVQSEATEEMVEDEARSWRIQLGSVSGLTAGEHAILLRIHHGDGETVTERSRVFNAADPTADLVILQLYNFPNPFEGGTEFHYRLNNEAERARLSIYTVRGRKIRSMETPARINDNIVVWDGRDEDGDGIANGLYFYKLQVWGRGGKSTSRIERIVRAR